MRSPLVLALTLVPLTVAGCLGDRAADGSDPATMAALAFGPGVAAVECRYDNCYEPSVAADPQGRLFAVDGVTSDVAVSEDGGRKIGRAHV